MDFNIQEVTGVKCKTIKLNFSTTSSWGQWSKAIVVFSSSTVKNWRDVGKMISDFVQSNENFDLAPIDNTKAILMNNKEFWMDEDKFFFKTWDQYDIQFCASPTAGFFDLAFVGIPYCFWSISLIQQLVKLCGSLDRTLHLSDLSAIRVKVRNTNGINEIPRYFRLDTPVGTFGVSVVVEAQPFMEVPPFPRIKIQTGIDGDENSPY